MTMKNTRRETVENIIDLIRWFDEYQPEDLEQIERILVGLQYVDNDIMKDTLKKEIYRNTKLIKGEGIIQRLEGISRSYFCMDINNRYNKK